jgi:hypothetical protein
MSVAFEGNAYLDSSVIVNTSIGNCIINTSSLDMLDSLGQYQRITNVASPINPHDVVIKEYIDTFTNNQTITLTGTNGTLISSILYGSYIITVKNIVNNGPSAIYNLSKKNQSVLPHRIRMNSCPDIATSTYLNVTWNIGEGIILSKTTGSFDGNYDIKLT